MGQLVTPILNGLGLANIGNSSLNAARGPTEQILKTVTSPADYLSAINDLQKRDRVSTDEVAALVSIAKSLEALASFFVKLNPAIGIGLSVVNLGNNLERARVELRITPDRPNPSVQETTQAAITTDFLSIIGGVALLAGAVGAASTVGLVLIPVGAVLTIAGVLGERGNPYFEEFVRHFNSLPLVPDWNRALKAVFLSGDYQYSAQSVALAQALLKIDPTLDRATINRLIDDAASSTDIAVEAVAAFNQLRGLFNPTATPLPLDASGAVFAQAVASFSPPSEGKVVSLGGQSRETLVALASNNFSFFIALDQLSAFAVVDTTASSIRAAQQIAYARDYALWSQDSVLTAEQRSQGQGNFSKLWYDDRAAMLTWKLKAQADELTLVGGVQTVRGTIAALGGESWIFKDLTTQTTVLVEPAIATSITRRVTFGGAIPEIIEGGRDGDHLYGGAGGDSLYGKEGNDYLAGQADDDILDGGDGSDILIGGNGIDTLNGGVNDKANDALVGGQGNDTYKFTGTYGTDTILDSDGLGRIQIDADTLTGGAQYGDNRVYRSADKKHLYVLAHDNTLLINNQIVVQSYNKGRGDLGLSYSDAPAQSNPSTTKDIKGDLKPADNDPVADGIQTTLDDIGNIVVGTEVLPDRLDTLYDSEGNDRITSGGGNDNVYLTKGGDDWVEAGAGRDWVRGGVGKDLIEGGGDADILLGGGSDDRLYAGSQVTVAQAIADGNTQSGTGQLGDFLSGNAGDDIAIGGTANEAILGGEGSDLLIGGAGDDRVYGDADWSISGLSWNMIFTDRDNTLFPGVGAANDSLTNYGNDVIYLGNGNDWGQGGRGNDVVYGEAGDDVLAGGGDNDALFGGAGIDVIYGDGLPANQGDDYLDGGADDDKLYGGAGSDILIGGTGNDTLEGGEGQDIYIFNKGDGSDTVIDSKAHKDIIRFGEGVKSTDIELRLGSLMLDFGNGDAVHIENFDRNDVYNSVAIDSFQFADGSALSATELLARGFDLNGTAQDDEMWGTNITDRMRGFAGKDAMIGGGGDDSLQGGAGDDILFGDDLTYEGSSFSIAGNTHGKDNLDGGDGNDQLVGGGNDDVLTGGAGNDKLFGDGDGLAAQFQGNDTLDGGDGDDELSGNGGNDVLLGGAGDDTLYGNEGNDVLDGGIGTNIMYGGAGDDTYIAHAGDTITDFEGLNTVQLDALRADIEASLDAGGTRLSLGGNSGGSASSILISDANTNGNTRINFKDGSSTTLDKLAATTIDTSVSSYSGGTNLYGGTQADSLFAYSGNSTITGGKGDDLIWLGGKASQVNYQQGDGVDTLLGPSYAGKAVIALSGGINPADLKLEVNSQRQVSVRFGANPDDRMILDINPDELKEAKLIERFSFEGADGNITSTLSFADLVARGVRMVGTALDDNLAGTNANDEIMGGAGSNTLTGGAGTDTYVVASGSTNTVIDSTGAGEAISIIRLAGVSSWADVVLTRPDAQSNDLLLTMPGNTTVTISSALLLAGQFSIALDDGQTRSLDSFLTGLPYLAVVGSDSSDAIVGSDQGNALSGGGGDDAVTGGAGDDLLSGGDGNDMLAGKGGSDILFGGAGDDVFVINPGSGHDQVFDYEGTNVVRFASGVTLAQLGFELLSGSTDVRITVDADTSVLVYRALEGAVTRYEFADGTQWSYGELVNRIAVTAGAVAVGDDLDNTVNGSAGNDLILGNRGNDLLNGFAGDDVLQGGDGDDTLAGNTGNDVLNGGVGADTFLFALGDGIDRMIDTIGASTIRFGAGIRLQDLSAEPVTVDGDVYIRLAYSNTDAVLIKEGVQLPGNAFVFADGTSLSQLQMYVAARHDARINPAFTEGADQIDGYAGNDVLAGGSGDDRINGNAGDDVLDGGVGSDQLIGGDGDDIYVMSANGGTDTVVEAAGQHSTVQLGAGDETSLTYSRAGADLLLSNTTLNTNFLVSNFYGAPSTWTLKTAPGVELDLHALAVAGQVGKSAEERREDFYDRMVAQAGPYNLGGQLFYGAGSREYSDAAGNEYAYGYRRERRLIESNGTMIEASSPDSTSSYNAVILRTITTTTSRQETVVDYTTSSTVQVTPGRNHFLGYGGTIVGGFTAAGFAVPSGWYTYKNSVNNAWYAFEPATYATTLTPHYITRTVTETQTNWTYRETYDATSIIEDVRAGAGDNTIQLSGSASKLVTGGEGNDSIQRIGATQNDAFDQSSGGPADWVDGGAGDDAIRLGAGKDDISGGSGSDFLDGGAGGDTYFVDSSDDGWDTIYDSANAVMHVELVSSQYGYLDADLANSLRILMKTVTFDSRDEYVQGYGWNGLPEGNYPRGNDLQNRLSGEVVVTAENINALLEIDRARPLFDRVASGNGSLFTRSALISTGLDRLISQIPGPAYLRDSGGTYFGDSLPPNWPTGPLSPAIVVTPQHLLSSLVSVSDTLRFSSGIDLSSLQIGWSVTESTSGTKDVMLISWGGQGGVKVVMPNADEPGVGIETFEFADGTHLTMQQMLALAPPRPGPGNSVIAGAALDTVIASEDAAFSYALPVTAFAIGGYKTPRFSATLGDDGQALPAWLQIDPLTGTLTGTPANGDVGNMVIKVTARQGPDEFASQMIELQVRNTNDAPLAIDYAYINEPTVRAGDLLSWSLPSGLYTDPDTNDRLSLKVEAADGSALPSWLKINLATGKLEGIPPSNGAGVMAVRLVATDLAGASASIPFSINILPRLNSTPTAQSMVDQFAVGTQAFTYRIPAGTFADADVGDTLTFHAELDSGEALPDWLAFSATTQTFIGTPPDTASGQLTIYVTATDQQGATASSSFSLDIAEIINGTALDDVMTGTMNADVINGGLGADRMTGGKGNDVYYVDNALDLVIERANEGHDTVRATTTYTLAANVEDLVLDGAGAIEGTGNTLDNRIEGNAADNKLMGGTGNDTLLGAAGDDWLRGGTGSDTLSGGIGDDLYEVDNTDDVVVEGLNEGVDTIEASVSYSLSAHIENLILTGILATDGTGNALDNLLQGNDAANVLTGGAGNDTLNGKKGLDSLVGGLGNDTYLLEDDVDNVIELAGEGRDTVISRYALTLADNIEDGMLLGSATSITGNALSNVLTGNTAANTIDGGAGADVMLGGKGNDTYIVDNQADTVIENAGEGTDTVQSSVDYTLADNLENLTLTGTAEAGMGNSLNNKLTGNAASNKLFGGAGSDDLDGGAGADILVGGLGNDDYWVDSSSDLVVESAGEGTDTVYASVSYALADNVERLVLTGSANINAVGNAGNNRLEGNAGNNILFGGLGNDTYVFGRGSGQDIVANFDAGKPSGDVVQLGAGIVDADLTYLRAGNDLVLGINGTADQLTVAGYFENGGKGANALEKIRFADGTSLNHAAVLSRTTVDTGVSEASGIPAAVRAGDPTSLFDAPVAADTQTSDAAVTPQSVAESINQAIERFEQGLQNLKLGTDEQGSLSRSEFAERRGLPLMWNLQDALLNLQLAKNADGRFTADVSIDSRATRDLGLGISLLGATNGMNGRLDQVARPADVQQFDLAQLN